MHDEERCPKCSGFGWIENRQTMEGWQTCPECHGSGKK